MGSDSDDALGQVYNSGLSMAPYGTIMDISATKSSVECFKQGCEEGQDNNLAARTGEWCALYVAGSG